MFRFLFTVSSCIGAVYTWKWYQHQKKCQQSVDETFFTMMRESECCYINDKNMKKIERCKNRFCMSKLMLKIIDHIDSAQSLICIAMYMLTNRLMADSLKRAVRRGVVVRIITDSSMLNSTNSQISQLQEEGNIICFLAKIMLAFQCFMTLF